MLTYVGYLQIKSQLCETAYVYQNVKNLKASCLFTITLSIGDILPLFEK